MKKVVTAPDKALLWIKWLDHARSGISWTKFEDVDAGPIICESVGWIARRGEKEGHVWIALCQSKSDQSGNCADLVTIIEDEILEWAEIK